MKRSLLFLLLLAMGLPGTAQNLETERILLYDVELRVDSSARLTVSEKIKVNALGQQIQRGIFRSLPERRQINGKDLAVRYNVSSVRKNGTDEEYHTKRENGAYVIYIGDEDVFLSPGVYDYEITYETYGQIGFFEGFDELYWNATGNGWVFPIDRVITRMILPDQAEIIQHACYTGGAGSTAQNCRSVAISDHSAEWTAGGLAPYQGLTVAAGFSKGVVQQPGIPAILQANNLWKVLAGIGVLLLACMIFLWNQHGRDHPTPTVIPQFEAPPGLSPAAVGYLYYGQYRQNFIASSLINLAIKGYLTIQEIPKKGLSGLKSFTLTTLDRPSEPMGQEESELLSDLFSGARSFTADGNKTLILDGQYDRALGSAVNSYQYRLTETFRPVLRAGSNWTKVLWLFLGISVVYWVLLLYGFQHLYEYDKLILGFILYFGALATLIILLSVRVFIARYMILLPLIFSGIGAAIWYYFTDKTIDAFILAYFLLFFTVIALATFNFLIKQPSPELLKKLSLINGFKMYLEAAENELLKFHNPPEMTPQLFEKYLPYALVLGVEGIWGEKLEQSLTQEAQDYRSNWYMGTSHHFTGSLAGSLNQSLSGTLTAASTAPGSGSGGGGSSGGGGGGGGGGGW